MSDIDWQQKLNNTELAIRNFIDGKYVDCLGNEIIQKRSARDGSLLYEFGTGNGEEVEQAVASARSAFEDGRWSRQSVSQRSAILEKLAGLIEEHKETFALYECLDVGKPITKALHDDIERALYYLLGSAAKADSVLNPSGFDRGTFVYRTRTPIGVVGGIVGWNYPLALAASKLGPALAMGNSLILKPSEFTALSAGFLAELAMEAGVPAGVFNVVHGVGAIVGDKLARHPDVGLLSFTGSSATGKLLMKAAGDSNMKRLLLECGGKSPYLIFDDCPKDLDYIVADIVETAFPNQGALCIAGTRLLLQESMKEKLMSKILEYTAKITPQDPLAPETTFGALINEAHMKKVLGYIESGKSEGAELIYGGQQVNQDSGGYYVEPAIFDNVKPNQTIAQEEIFGPVLSIMTFKDEAEAIKLANDNSYGLAAYVATENLGRALRLGQQLNAGVVMIVGTSTPSGGEIDLGIEPQKESGFGTEGGVAGMEAYTVSSTVYLRTSEPLVNLSLV